MKSTLLLLVLLALSSCKQVMKHDTVEAKDIYGGLSRNNLRLNPDYSVVEIAKIDNCTLYIIRPQLGTPVYWSVCKQPNGMFTATVAPY